MTPNPVVPAKVKVYGQGLSLFIGHVLILLGVGHERAWAIARWFIVLRINGKWARL